MALSPTMTVHDLLDSYPFLDEFLLAYHPVFARLRDAGQWGTWGRVVTVSEVSTTMNIAWRLFLRDIETEVGRVTGMNPVTVSESLSDRDEEAAGDEVCAVVDELEHGGSLAEAARRMTAVTRGMDDGQVAQLAHRHTRRGLPAADDIALAPAALPPAHGLGPGHPVSALRRECERFAQLAAHLEEAAARLDERAEPELLETLAALLRRLDELAVQRERLTRAWFPTLESRGGRGPSGVVGERLTETLRLAGRLRVAVERGDLAAVQQTSGRYLEALRRTLAGEEELLVPLSLRALDSEDWEALGEQERVVGWALQGGPADASS